MKTLLGVLLIASFAGGSTMAQQKNDQQQTDQPAVPGIRPKIEPLAQSWFQLLAQTKDDNSQTASGGKWRKLEDLSPIPAILIEGAVYISIGDTLIPWPGGGASGCFDPTGAETSARIEKAKAEWAKRLKKD